jgi:hypothetical protein
MPYALVVLVPVGTELVVLVPVGTELVVVVSPGVTEDEPPLSWPPFEVDVSEGEARFEMGGPGNV